MPCWEVNEISVEFKAKHRSLLESALDRMGSHCENDFLVMFFRSCNRFCQDFEIAGGKNVRQGIVKGRKRVAGGDISEMGSGDLVCAFADRKCLYF